MHRLKFSCQRRLGAKLSSNQGRTCARSYQHCSNKACTIWPFNTRKKTMASNPNQKLAVLIDADNAQAAVIQELLAEVSRYGTATIKRAYGDWTTQNLKSWKEVLHKLAIQPIQQFSYTTGKNSTDA